MTLPLEMAPGKSCTIAKANSFNSGGNDFYNVTRTAGGAGPWQSKSCATASASIINRNDFYNV